MMSAAAFTSDTASSPARPGNSGRRTTEEVVGARGFEPPTSRSRTVRATRLRYAPIRPGYCTYPSSSLPGVLSDELHEFALAIGLLADLAVEPFDDGQHLVFRATDGQHHAAALGELR